MPRKINTKFCPACQKEHPTTDFGKDKTSRDGLYRICLIADRAQQRAWREAKKAKIAAEQEAAEAKKAARRERRRAKATTPAK